jgi:hypothetical protein
MHGRLMGILRLMVKLLDREMGICSAEWGDGCGVDRCGQCDGSG